MGERAADNPNVAVTSWQKRIERAESLAQQYAFATEILSFYSAVARFQSGLYEWLSTTHTGPVADFEHGPPQLPLLIQSVEGFISMIEERAPAKLKEGIRDWWWLREEGAWSQLLTKVWTASNVSPTRPNELMARAFLQPCAEWTRSRTGKAITAPGETPAHCPFCRRRPGMGVLRQQGDGGRRSLICSFCLNEWEFRRIVCPACGEEENAKLPVYTAEEFAHIRVECCDRCKTYIKTVDLTRNGLADPVVDELLSGPLDLWAQEHGYSKLELNVLGM